MGVRKKGREEGKHRYHLFTDMGALTLTLTLTHPNPSPH